MKIRYLGYACINTGLGRTTNKTLRLKNLNYDKYFDIVNYNLDSLKDIILWNQANKINFFRIGSEIIPLASHRDFNFDWKADFGDKIKSLRKLAQVSDMRFSMHPGQYTVLNSLNDNVVFNALKEIEFHSDFLDFLYPDKGKIVIHIGGVYGDKISAIERFCKNFYRLSERAQKKLIIENDDKSYNIVDVLEISQKLDIPVVFDILHHKCNADFKDNWRLNIIDNIKKVVNSWKGDIPIFHISSKKGVKGCSHTDYIEDYDFNEFTDIINNIPVNICCDIMVEAKMKEKAVLRLISQ
ncbi:MAG: UV DNA damage repair endonuclease UvsE [Candidatus Muirbacterium halophilum]|nr:UV DNA damage repair endonuclease UvsE [Candidatus Muirbacterium halophilum]MCK9474367.1 UV DNA damage repair endonuclease UvsE [Candidatus Muirbacterium halophilum]